MNDFNYIVAVYVWDVQFVARLFHVPKRMNHHRHIISSYYYTCAGEDRYFQINILSLYNNYQEFNKTKLQCYVHYLFMELILEVSASLFGFKLNGYS